MLIVKYYKHTLGISLMLDESNEKCFLPSGIFQFCKPEQFRNSPVQKFTPKSNSVKY